MSTRAPRSGFARRPADPETWVRAAKEQPAGRADGAANTARLTIDVTPAQRGRIKIAAFERGMTVAVANANVTPVQRALANDLLAAVGDVMWVDDEALLDPVTAVSGSGPAYVFYLTECLAEAGRAAGLDAAFAEKLARATVIGSAALMEASEVAPAELRRNVTSPGGTTAAALEVLGGESGLKELMTAAVAAATKRGRELAK